jgi:ring-1,2-phenylacetyl-CoA epoxidase subunit PaaE
VTLLARLLHPRPVDLAHRVTAARRDLRAALALLRGKHASPTVARTSRRRPTAELAGATATARELAIVEVRRETADAITLVLADPSGASIGFRPGQFFTLLIDLGGPGGLGGDVVRRAYSASSLHTDPTRVAITIKRVDGGRASTHLHATARAGQRVRVLGPSGDFGVAPDPARARHVVLIGGGSGITPLMSIARGVLAVEPASRVTLVYGNRGDADVIFAAELDALAAAHPALRVHHVLEHAHPRAARVGRLDQATTAAILDDALAGAPAPDGYFVCGPEPMMAAVRAALIARGVTPAAIHEERFASLRPAAPAARGPVAATIRIGGVTRTIAIAPGATLLDAGLDAGLPMPFSCAMGGCGACAVDVVDGAVEHDLPNCLDDGERARGRALACVARPTGPCTIEVRR